MSGERALVYVEVDVDYCSLRYGEGACPAILGVDSADKCFNSLKTCAVRTAFTNDPVTIRFAQDNVYLPKDIPAIPSITGVQFSPATISLGKDLGQRATLTVGFRDHKHSDTGEGFDKYHAERSYNPFDQGSFWGKFRARQPYLKGRSIRLIRGYLGQTLAEMDTRHYIIESFNGPTPQGSYTLIAKDVLKLADGDRAQAPMVSNGFLVSAIDEVATTLNLSPNGIGDFEYPNFGWIAIGGEEIMEFTRTGGIDDNTLLMLHGDGADNGTTFTDSSASNRTATRVGTPVTDTGLVVHGTASLQFPGSDDFLTFPDDDAWSFPGDFTIDCWVYVTDLSINRVMVSHSDNTADNHWRFQVGTSGALGFIVFVGGVLSFSIQSPASSITINSWTHVAVVREGTTWRMYVNGFEASEEVNATAITNYSGLLRVGVSGDGTSFDFFSNIDELRISKVARSESELIAGLLNQYNDGDILQIVRGQLGTTAAEHDVQDRVQLVVRYDGADPADILYDLFTNYAQIPAEYISLGDWQTETGSFLQRLYGATIADPTDVTKLVSELVEQAALAIWWDDVNQLIRLKVLRSILTDTALFDDDNIMAGSLTVQEQPNLRASQIWTYYGQRNPLRPIDEPDNFRSTLATVNLQAESDEGQPAIMKIFARWIPAFGRDTAERLNDIQLGRYQTPPRRVTFDVFRGSVDDPVLGSGYQVGAYSIQDEFGAPVTMPIQLTRLNPMSDRFSVEGEEMLFEALDPADLLDRTIVIDSDILDVNLRDLHDSIYPEPVAFESPSITVTCIVESDVLVGASGADIPAFDVGDWPGGVTITVINNGRIQGAGGDGGDGGNFSGSNFKDGEAGGTAVYTRYPIMFEDAAGQTYGGGGGGGGGYFRGGGGGGGAGQVPGEGGPFTTDQNSPKSGAPGTLDAGGIGGDGGGEWDDDGGNGGTPGVAGGVGEPGPPTAGAGGAAGHAIDGLSFITQVGAEGDRLGGEVN